MTTGPNVRPGDLPPVLPAAGQQHDSAGAIVFALYYYSAVDWAYSTNDSYLITKLALPTCRNCQSLIDALDGLNDHGATLTGGHIRVASAALDTKTYDFAPYVVRVTVSQDPATESGPSSKTSTVVRATDDLKLLVFLRWNARAWHVADVTSS